MNDFMPERFPYLERMRSMLANPLAVIDYFHNTVAAIIASVIEGRMFGEGARYYGVIEYQGRGTPHIHILVCSLSLSSRDSSTDVPHQCSFGSPALDPPSTYGGEEWRTPISA